MNEARQIDGGQWSRPGDLNIDEWCDYWLRTDKVWEADGIAVGDALPDLQAAAEWIRAHQAHDDLLAALQELAEGTQDATWCILKARAALAKATATQT